MIVIDETKFSDNELKFIEETISALKYASENWTSRIRCPWESHKEWEQAVRPFLDMLEPIDVERCKRIDKAREKDDYKLYLELKARFEESGKDRRIPV